VEGAGASRRAGVALPGAATDANARPMKHTLVAIATITAMFALPALASGTLTELGAVGLKGATGSSGTTGASGASGPTGATGRAGVQSALYGWSRGPVTLLHRQGDPGGGGRSSRTPGCRPER
jgi:hypothetical protein